MQLTPGTGYDGIKKGPSCGLLVHHHASAINFLLQNNRLVASSSIILCAMADSSDNEVVHLVSSSNPGTRDVSSGFAYYPLGLNSGRPLPRPTEYVDVVHGSVCTWEGQQQQGMHHHYKQ